MNPYTVLNVSPSATDDEVKKAYRQLAKKYHPDVCDEPDAERKFKEVQAAYDEICDIRSGKTFNNSSSYYSNNYRNTSNSYYYNNSSFYRSTSDSSYNTAYDYIQQGRYKEASDILDSINQRSAMWFYLSAVAQNGLGNVETAKTYAKAAVDMEPTNFTYRSLYAQLNGNGMNYQSRYNTSIFGNNTIFKTIFRILIINLLLMMFFGRGSGLFLLPFLFF